MLPADAGDTSEGRTPVDNQTARSVFVIGPDKKIKATLTYPMSTGRNFAEILRLLDSVQLTAREKVATPANWQQGDDVIILPAVSDEEAREKYPEGWQQPCPTFVSCRSRARTASGPGAFPWRAIGVGPAASGGRQVAGGLSLPASTLLAVHGALLSSLCRRSSRCRLRPYPDRRGGLLRGADGQGRRSG